jgi:hypothetical protein
MSDIQFRTVPTFTEQLTPGNTNNQKWYRYFQQNEKGTPPSGELNVIPVGSPFSYQAPQKGFVIITGAGISEIMFSRTPGQFYLTGQTAGSFPMAQNDTIKIVFSGARPVVTFVPT